LQHNIKFKDILSGGRIAYIKVQKANKERQNNFERELQAVAKRIEEL